jgi:hypothetical protein
MIGAPTSHSTRDPVFLALTRDGRVRDEAVFERLERRARGATDAFVFCHGWLYDEAEARHEAARFFALLDGALLTLGQRVHPLRIALHWPSKPFADASTRDPGTGGLWAELERLAAHASRVAISSEQLARLLSDLSSAEVPQGPEDEAELDGLLHRLRDGDQRGGLPITPLQALSFWVMKRRAGDVGERFGRERLGPFWHALPSAGPRLHLIGHSFGAKLLTSAVLGGLSPQSLTLLLAAFSAFSFAPAVPGFDRPGFYHRVLGEQWVRGPIVVLRSVHDHALDVLYPRVATNVDRGTVQSSGATGRIGHTARAVARSALGAVGARGVNAPEVELLEAQTIGIPRRPIVNVDGSRVVCAQVPFLGAHRDIHHQEVATLILLAAGLLEGGPEGVRPPRIQALTLA